MSLSALNSPPLIAAVGGGAWVIFPMLGGLQFPLATLQYANFLSYCANVASVSVPGRLDGQQQVDSLGDGRIMTTEMTKARRSLVAPSGWAFIIWAPIFMGELALVVTQLFVSPDGPVASFLHSASIPYVAANAFQCLWCSAFRPKYKGKWMAVSFSCLASTAYWLSKVHNSALSLTGWNYVIYGIPISLHFGWITAATLVNLNGAFAMHEDVSPKIVAWIGHGSVIAATAIGLLVTLSRRAPVYGGVICWALAAVTDGMAKRVAATKDDPDQKRVGVMGAKLQYRLSQIGAILTGGVAFAVAVVTALDAKHDSRRNVAP